MDTKRIRQDFPILQRRVAGQPLIYLDNAATTHKPRQVLETIQTLYTTYNANIHRSPHTLGQEATDLYEQTHRNVARFVGAQSWREIVFVRNSTEGINLVLYSLLNGQNDNLKLVPGDEIVLTVMEHHSNLVPWQMARGRCIHLRFADVQANGTLDVEQFKTLLSDRTKLVCCTHVSNVLGTVNPVHEIASLAHTAGALCLVDGAQSVPHLPIDVQELDCDFMVFSGHKMLAPMGIGVLYGKHALLQAMSPFMYGGDMIDGVTLDNVTWNELPWKFEAGTPNVCGAVALGGATDRNSGKRLEGAIDYLDRVGMDRVQLHTKVLVDHALQGLRQMPRVCLYGPKDSTRRCGVVSFNVEKDSELVDAHLIAQMLNDDGIAVRAGGHCAYPLVERMGVPGTVRASFYVYNTLGEVERFLEALDEISSQRLL